jgi:peroxiredoxin
MRYAKPSLIAALLVATASLLTFGADAPKGPVIGEPAPTFSAKDSTGKSVTLADLKGKVVVLEWINKDCPIDARVIDAGRISAVYDKFKDKVTWLAVDSTASHTANDYANTIAMWKLAYPIINDATGIIGHAYAATNTPQMFIINTDGKLVYNGAIDNDPNGSNAKPTNYVDQALTELLAGKTISIAESKPYGCTVKYAK